MSLYSSSVKRPVTTILVFVALIVLGLFSLRSLPIDLFPDVETNTIMVMTSYAGTSASDIEQNVTRPLENVLNSVEHLKHITSNSRENISIVTLEFEYGYNIETLTNDVRDKLDMVSSMLPDDANTPIIFKFSSDMIQCGQPVGTRRWRGLGVHRRCSQARDPHLSGPPAHGSL